MGDHSSKSSSIFFPKGVIAFRRAPPQRSPRARPPAPRTACFPGGDRVWCWAMRRPLSLALLTLVACGGAPVPAKRPPVDPFSGAELRPTSPLSAEISVVSALPRPLRVPLDACSELFVYAESGPLTATADAGSPEANPIALQKTKIARFSGAHHVDIQSSAAAGVPAVLVLARKEGASWPTYASSRKGPCAYGSERDASVAILDPENAAPQRSLEGALTIRSLAGAKNASVPGLFASLDLLQGRPDLRIPEETATGDEVLYVEDGEGIVTAAEATTPFKGGGIVPVPRGTKHSLTTTAEKAFFALRVRAPIPH